MSKPKEKPYGPALERLMACGGNKPKAAEQLGVSLKTLYDKLNQATSIGKSA